MKALGYKHTLTWLYWKTKEYIIRHTISETKPKDEYLWNIAFPYDYGLKANNMAPATIYWISCTLRMSRKSASNTVTMQTKCKINVDYTPKNTKITVRQLSAGDLNKEITITGPETVTVDLGVYLCGHRGYLEPKEQLQFFTTIHEWVSGIGCYIDNLFFGKKYCAALPGSLYSMLKWDAFNIPTPEIYPNGSGGIKTGNIQGQYGRFTLTLPFDLPVSLSFNHTIAIKMVVCPSTTSISAVSARLKSIYIESNSGITDMHLTKVVYGAYVPFSNSPLDSDRMFTLEFVFVAMSHISSGEYRLVCAYEGGDANSGANTTCSVTAKVGHLCSAAGSNAFFNN